MMYGAPVPVLHRGQKGLATGMRISTSTYIYSVVHTPERVDGAIYFVGESTK